MDIKKTLTACLLAAGLALVIVAPMPAEARHRKVVVKHKYKHHRHPIGVKHIGRGAKHKTIVKTSR